MKLDRPLTVDGLLRYAGVDDSERGAWVEAFSSSAHWGILSPGHQVSIFKDAETGRVQFLYTPAKAGGLLEEQKRTGRKFAEMDAVAMVI